MIDEDRLHREIDGLLTAAESSRLQQELSADPEAKARLATLRRLQQALASVPSVEPPKGLVEDVMRSVRARARARAAHPGAWDALRAAFSRRPGLGLSLSFASGLLLAAVGSGLLSTAPSSPGHDADAMGAAMPPARLREIARAPLQGRSLAGEATALEAGGQVLVRVRVLPGEPLDLEVTWSGEAASPLAFEREGEGASSVVLGPGSVEVRGASAGLYTLRWPLGAAPGPVRVHLRRGGDEAVAELHAPGRP